MLYYIIHIFVKATCWLYCKKITVNNKTAFQESGPTLIIANHPNSFLDAILIGSIFKRRIHYLARGDAFKKKRHRTILKMLNMIPVYRLREGKENLHLNGYAFEESRRILNNGGIVLIFIEGICLNIHDLQPFKKGAARIAESVDPEKNLKILPISIAYNSFNRFGKSVVISAGKTMEAKQLFPYKLSSRNYNYFNQYFFPIIDQLIQLPVYEKTKNNIFYRTLGTIGKLIHLPYYYPVQQFVKERTAGTVFYDSVLFGLMLITYPIYLLLISCLLFAIFRSFYIILLSILIHLISARIYVLHKKEPPPTLVPMSN